MNIERSMLASDDGQWMYVIEAEHIGNKVVCDGYVGDPDVPVSKWMRATVTLDDDDMPEVLERRAYVWDSNDTVVGGNR